MKAMLNAIDWSEKPLREANSKTHKSLLLLTFNISMHLKDV